MTDTEILEMAQRSDLGMLAGRQWLALRASEDRVLAFARAITAQLAASELTASCVDPQKEANVDDKLGSNR